MAASSGGFAPTDEQLACLDAFASGQNTAITAGAGAGKTSTLRLLAEKAKRKGQLIAYNRTTAQDAKASFPRNVVCSTAHSLAYRAIGHKYEQRMNGPRVTGRQAAMILSINDYFNLPDNKRLGPIALARLVLDTVTRYCYSADPEPAAEHVPWVNGADSESFAELQRYIVPFAKRAWSDIQGTNGRLRFVHDHYLKMWALTDPQLHTDFLMLDEGQDTNPVVANVFMNQSEHSQLVIVGDANQQIYAWRGAQDYMSKLPDSINCKLSKSFRFGPAVAAEANKWLTALDADLRIEGFEQINSTVGEYPDAKAVLCRTNATATAEALQAHEEDNKRYALVGGTDDMKRFADAAAELMGGKQPHWHPDLAPFQNWASVQEYVEEDSGGSDIKVLVNMIDSHGTEKIKLIADMAVPEKVADIIISTAHKAKGREWDSVRIASDFREPEPGDEFPRSEGMLAYVSVTRAKLQLDCSWLSWIDNWIPRQQEVEQ